MHVFLRVTCVSKKQKNREVCVRGGRSSQQKNTRRSQKKNKKVVVVSSFHRVVALFKEAKEGRKTHTTHFITLSRALLEKMTVSSSSSFHTMGGGSGGGSGGADDPYLLQSLKGGHRNNAITALAFAPQSKRYIFSSSTGDGSIMFWHVGGLGGGGGSGGAALIKNRKRPVRFLGHERDVLALAHTEREGEGGRCASAGLDRSVRIWKATAYVLFVSLSSCRIFFSVCVVVC